MARPTLPGNRGSEYEAGFTYVALLCVLAGVALMLGVAAEQIEHAAQRDREEQLLFVGNQFRHAIASYYEKSPGAKQYPRKLEDLLQDNRFPKPMRHLRRIYPDPMDNRAGWQLERTPQGTIVGVCSRSDLTPIRTNLDDDLMAVFGNGPILHYSDWKFVYRPLDGSADLVRSAGGDKGLLSDPDSVFGQAEGEQESPSDAAQQEDSDTDSSPNASHD